MNKAIRSAFACLASFRATILLMIVYGLLLGIASFAEKFGHVDLAKNLYYNPLVALLWALMTVNWGLIAYRRREAIPQKLGYYLLHTSFLFIITGALLTHFLGTEGVLHVREGERTNQIHLQDGTLLKLPFFVRLDDFQLTRYSGSNSPRSYSSTVTIEGMNAAQHTQVSMNKVINVQGYRLFQTAYDPDESGTILTVSHDPAGMTVTYVGYILLLAGILLLPLQRTSRLRQLIRKLTMGILLLLAPLSSAQARVSWDEVQVQNPNGRIEPLDTYCRTIARKVHHSESLCGRNATEFILGLMSDPGYWNRQPIIYQGNREIQHSLGLEGRHVCFNDMFDAAGKYRLANEVAQIYSKSPAQQNKREKDLLKLDEKMNIILSLEQGQLLPLFPLPGDSLQRWFSPGDDLSVFHGEDSLFVSTIMPWYFTEPSQEIIHMINIYQHKQSASPLLSDTQVWLELLYNRLNPFFCTAIVYLLSGLLLLLFLFIRLARDSSRIYKWICRLLTGIILLSFLVHTAGIIVRWYVGEQAPWSNAYESMVYAAWCTLLASLLFIRHSQVTLAVGALFSGILLMVSQMNWMDPVITPLVPVLQSYWLMIHVAVIICGYGFLAIGFLLGLTNLVLMQLSSSSPALVEQIRRTAIINEITLLLGLCLMTVGTFLGAVWANEAWGRYWGWDPKETWALITILVYVAITHARFVPCLNNIYTLSVLSVLGFSTVLMTYLGVNLFFSGMHSYGSGSAPSQLYGIGIFYVIILVLCFRAKHWNQQLTSDQKGV